MEEMTIIGQSAHKEILNNDRYMIMYHYDGTRTTLIQGIQCYIVTHPAY